MKRVLEEALRFTVETGSPLKALPFIKRVLTVDSSYLKQFIELYRSGANKLKTFIDKIKRRAVQEAAPNRPTAKQELGATYA